MHASRPIPLSLICANTFVSLGNTGDFNQRYLLMEEQEAGLE